MKSKDTLHPIVRDRDTRDTRDTRDAMDMLDSLHLHNTTFAGLQQKPGPHSHHPAVLFSGVALSYNLSS